MRFINDAATDSEPDTPPTIRTLMLESDPHTVHDEPLPPTRTTTDRCTSPPAFTPTTVTDPDPVAPMFVRTTPLAEIVLNVIASVADPSCEADVTTIVLAASAPPPNRPITLLSDLHTVPSAPVERTRPLTL